VVTGTVVGITGEARTAERLATPPSPQLQRPHPEDMTPAGQPRAEVTFATPQHFAVITEVGSKHQRLYGVGDTFVDPLDAGHGVTIQRIERGRVQVREARTQRAVWVAEGNRVPGFADRRVKRTVLLSGLDYQYVTAGSSLDSEPRLLDIRGNRAALEVDVPPPRPVTAVTWPLASAATGVEDQIPALSRKLDATLLGRVRVREAGPNVYEVSATDLQNALDHGGQVLAEAWPTVWPLVSLRDGVSLQVRSPVADGVLGPRGFRVTSPNLAERAGIEVGDVVLAVNGQAVNSFGDLYSLYQKVQRDSPLSTVELSLERQGVPVTKIYQIR
jgi:hypothetical protein